MSHSEMAPARTRDGHGLDFKLEVVVLPVTDFDRAERRGVAYAEYMVHERAGEELPREPIGARRES